MCSVDDILLAFKEELPGDVYGVALEPPDLRAQSDEHSDAEGGADPNRLNRHQLRAPCCHVFRCNTESDSEAEDFLGVLNAQGSHLEKRMTSLSHNTAPSRTYQR